MSNSGYYSAHPISLSMGYASTIEDESIDDMLKRADQAMYKQKNDYYAYLRAENNNE